MLPRTAVKGFASPARDLLHGNQCTRAAAGARPGYVTRGHPRPPAPVRPPPPPPPPPRAPPGLRAVCLRPAARQRGARGCRYPATGLRRGPRRGGRRRARGGGDVGCARGWPRGRARPVRAGCGPCGMQGARRRLNGPAGRRFLTAQRQASPLQPSQTRLPSPQPPLSPRPSTRHTLAPTTASPCPALPRVLRRRHH
jgi:hypothetical protein